MPSDTEDRGKLLTALARASIASRFGEATPDLPHPSWLDEAGAVFVTLTQAGELRGCIGTLEAHRPLAQDVEENARMAAFRDPRFQPLRHDELNRSRVEVSVLSRPESMSFTDEADALRQLRPGMDGVILEYGPHRATFLPQVWEQLPEPGQFMAQLKRKAGLPPDFWAEDVRLSRYTVEKYEEPEAASLKEG